MNALERLNEIEKKVQEMLGSVETEISRYKHSELFAIAEQFIEKYKLKPFSITIDQRGEYPIKMLGYKDDNWKQLSGSPIMPDFDNPWIIYRDGKVEISLTD